jgi:transposase-like protein
MSKKSPEQLERERQALAARIYFADAVPPCPDCGNTDIEDNGQSGRWLEYRCKACDHRFGPGSEA